MRNIRDDLGDPDGDITLYASDAELERREAFQALMDTKFGSGYRKMLDEYAALQGMAIVAFNMPGGAPYFGDLEIVFSGSGSGLDGSLGFEQQ